MINKFEVVGIGVSIAAMAVALFLLRAHEATTLTVMKDSNQQAAVVVSNEATDERAALGEALEEATGNDGKLSKLLIDDVTVGIGKSVESGDTVTVDYIGALQNGQEFDNSYKKGKPFTFTVGEGKVIPGWEQGLVGMQLGGQRILVIPAELAYGETGVGPIPGGATLVFTVELLDIK